jgi:tetratricopeptide (TPR) repeat protein
MITGMWFPGAYRYPRWRSERAFLRGDNDGAISILSKYLKRRPRDPMAWLLLGCGLDRARRYEEAEDRLREGLQHHPDFHELRVKLAQVLFMQWKFEEARQQWQLVLEENPSSPHAYEGLASISLWEGDEEQARRLIEESISRRPDPILSMDLALLLVCIPGGRPRAGELLRAASQAKGFRRDPIPHLLLAMFLEKTDPVSSAREMALARTYWHRKPEGTLKRMESKHRERLSSEQPLPLMRPV